jgi:predicted secreted hydrolase
MSARRIHAHLVPRLPWLFLALCALTGFAAWLIFVWGSGREQSAPLPSTQVVDWSELIAALGDEEGFAPPSGPWQLTLPADHGAHPETRSESWLLSGMLSNSRQEKLGFQLGLQRFALVPEAALAADSPWRSGEVYRAHLLLANGTTGLAQGEERFSRAAIGLAGHAAAERRLWLERWMLEYGLGAAGGQLRLVGTLADTTVELVLAPHKAPVTVDEAQGRAPFRGYAHTRLVGSGVLRSPAGEEPVSAGAWLEHLWGEVPLPIGPIVWDRAQLQLDDGSEVLVVRSRRRDGRGEATISGYRLDANGLRVGLEPDESRFEPTGDPWRDPRSGARYPLSWRLATAELELQIDPLLEAQAHDFVVPFWGGLVSVHGRSEGEAVSGAGFLELTGYETAP